MSTATAHVAMRLKAGYRRTESEPANTMVNGIRCKFESSADALITEPDVGLSFGFKRSTPSSPNNDIASPVVLRKTSEVKSPLQNKDLKGSVQIRETKFPVQRRMFDRPSTHIDSTKTSPVTPNSDAKISFYSKDLIPSTKPLDSKTHSHIQQRGSVVVKGNESNGQLKQVGDRPASQTALKHPSPAVSAPTITDKHKKVAVKPTSLTIPNSNQSKHMLADKPSQLICLHNTGIVSTRKHNLLSSPTISPTVTVPCLKSNKALKTHSIANSNKSSSDCFSLKTKTGESHQPTTTREKANHSPLLESKAPPQHSAKTFWKSKSVDSEALSKDGGTRQVDSIFEPGTDYSRLKKGPVKDTARTIQKSRSASLCTISKPAQQSIVGENKKESGSLPETKAQRVTNQVEDTRPAGSSLSKSPSVSSTCSSLDSFEDQYINGLFSHKMKRRDTKPPQNIVARRTQLFEKSLDEINSVVEEAEAYNKVKEAGFGTVFTPKDPSASSPQLSKPKIISSVPPSALKPSPNNKATVSSADKISLPPDGILNNSVKTLAKNQLGLIPAKPVVMTDKNKNIVMDKVSSGNGSPRTKPLPPTPENFQTANPLKQFPPPTASKPKMKGPPPKPPRTFEHPVLTPSCSNEVVFDPVVIPRQAGDGEENHDYERQVSCESPHVYTSVTLASDTRTYTTTTSADTRPYTSLTTTGGSGGDDSVAGSENAYDTLGRASVASSYEHYDTISQSELDSDVSRPPTLPRRPSNLRQHRPLTTAFSHLDISKNNTAFHHQLNKALSSTAQTIKETSPTSPSPTKIKVPFKLKYLLPKALRRGDEMRKASSMADLLDEKESLYDVVQLRPSTAHFQTSQVMPPEVTLDEAGYALPDIKVSVRSQCESVSMSM